MLDDTIRRFIKEHKNDDVRRLALQSARYPDIDMHRAMMQIEGLQLAAKKLPSWAATEDVLFPPRISMEQCSSEATAQYKARLAGGESIADLTGGFGVDCSYMADNFNKAYYVERNEELCKVAAHNFAVLGKSNVRVLNGNAEEVLHTLPRVDWIFIDPARRDMVGNKVFQLSECEPDIVRMYPLLLEKTEKILVKCSPMLDITAACRELPGVSDVHVVAVNNECKELLLIISAKNSDSVKTHCINILKEKEQYYSFIDKGDNNGVCYASRLFRFLYEPNAAIQKAGCHNSLARDFGISKLHPNSQLFTSDEFIADFPGRVFEILGCSNFSKAEIKHLLDGCTQANLTVRNFPENVNVLRKRLKITEGGDVYLFATTLSDDSRVLLKCRKA